MTATDVQTQDRRLLFANPRVAHADLVGRVQAMAFRQPTVARALRPYEDLRAAPSGARDKQILLGQPLEVLERHDGWAFVRDMVDDYVGYLPDAAVGEAEAPTHRIGVRSAHIYSEPNMKSADIGQLSFFSEITAAPDVDGFHALASGGFVAAQHVVPFDWRAQDPVSIAETFLGTPYLWGGNTGFGIDCSGLVQMALYAAGRSCPRDADLQEAALGQLANDGYRRGDLLFWKGHVAFVSDPQTILHANAHHMAVAFEPIDAAIARIEEQGDGPVTSHKRLGGA